MGSKGFIRRATPATDSEDLDRPEMLDRLSRAGGGGGLQLRVASGEKARKRKRYPTDERRQQRAVTAVLPTAQDKERLARAAQELSRVSGMAITPSSMAAMCLMVGLALYETGELELAAQTEETSRWFLQRR